MDDQDRIYIEVLVDRIEYLEKAVERLQHQSQSLAGAVYGGGR